MNMVDVLDGGEARNAILLTNGAVGISINLGDDDVGLVLESKAELLPVGGEVLAVTAPGGVELNEDILRGVVDDLIEVSGSQGNNLKRQHSTITSKNEVVLTVPW